MRAERFQTQARLLASTRPDGHEATAIDTRNTFQYINGAGWAQIVPATDPHTGSPFTAGQPLVAEGTGGITYETADRFLPAADTAEPGQILTVSPSLVPEYTTRQTTGATVTYPVDFTDGLAHTIYGDTVPGGLIGDHGFARFTALGRVSNGAVGTPTAQFGCSLLGLPMTLDSPALTQSGSPYWGLEYELLFINYPSGLNVVRAKLVTTKFTALSTTTLSDDLNQHVWPESVDMSADWTPELTVTASTAITGEAFVYAVLFERGYIA